jgi:competence protein ComEC
MKHWLQGKMHPSWHITWTAAGVLAGIVAAGKWRLGFSAAVLGVAVFIFVSACLLGWRWLIVCAFLAGVVIGAARAETVKSMSDPLMAYVGRTVQLGGVVIEDPGLGKRGDQQLYVAVRQIGSTRIDAAVWVSSRDKPDIRRGDGIILEGDLRPGFGAFSASMGQAKILRIIRSYPGDAGVAIRDWFTEGIRGAIGEPQAALGIGYLTGQQTALPPELDEQLRAVGLTHAVVASGYNLTILVGFARSLLLGVSKYLSTVLAAGMILLFMLVTGLSPSMSRAGLVAGVGLVVWYYGRFIHPSVLLLFAAAVTALYKPTYIWGDLGWYLSFTAFFGIIVLAPLIKDFFWGDEPPKGLWNIIIETLSAQITTLPVIIYSFGLVAVYALPANILVVPLVPLAMLLVFMAGIIGLMFPAIAGLAGLPAEALLSYMVGVVKYIAALPGAQAEIHFSLGWLWASYAVLVGIVLMLWRITGYNFRQKT